MNDLRPFFSKVLSANKISNSNLCNSLQRYQVLKITISNFASYKEFTTTTASGTLETPRLATATTACGRSANLECTRSVNTISVSLCGCSMHMGRKPRLRYICYCHGGAFQSCKPYKECASYDGAEYKAEKEIYDLSFGDFRWCIPKLKALAIQGVLV
eukprot:g70850.t1